MARVQCGCVQPGWDATSNIFWMKWFSKQGPLEANMIYLDSSWKTVCFLQLQRKKIYNIQEGLILKSWWNQLTLLRSHMATGTREILLQAMCPLTCQLSHRAHPSHHLFNALKTTVGYVLHIVCFRLSCSSGQWCQCFPGWPQPSAPQNQCTPPPNWLYFHLSHFYLTIW